MKKAKRFLTGLLSAALALSLCAMPAMAADNGETPATTPPQDVWTQETGSITIHMARKSRTALVKRAM